MSKSTRSVAVLDSILKLIQSSGVQSNPKEYPLNTVRNFAYMSFMIGALMIKLNPKRFKDIEKEIPQHKPYTMSMEIDLVKRIEQARNIEGIITSEPYLAWIYNDIDDYIKEKQHSFATNLTMIIGIICFQRGCIFGSMYPKRIESMYRAEYSPANIYSWENLVKFIRQWIKNSSFN